MSKFKDLKGMRFNRLLVLERANIKGRAKWKCQCDCGNMTLSVTYSLLNGDAQSCGCMSREKIKATNTTHGKSNTKIYNVWVGIKKRCSNQNYEHYARYGGRGICLCEEWKSFPKFYEWAMSNEYSEELTIERIDVNGNYSPDNCKWIPFEEQGRNRADTVFVLFTGTKIRLKELSNQVGMDYKYLHAHYKKGDLPNIVLGVEYINEKKCEVEEWLKKT